MVNRNRKAPQGSELQRAQVAARTEQSASAQLVEFAERLGPEIGPAEQLEYDTLIAREAAAMSDRVEAFGRLGFGAPSLDATGPPDA
jgi:hypothetical protein